MKVGISPTTNQYSEWSNDVSISPECSFVSGSQLDLTQSKATLQSKSIQQKKWRFSRTGLYLQFCNCGLIHGIILGLLVGGIALAIVITLWMTPPKKTSDVIQSTISITTTTTTSATSTTTTTSVSTTTTTTTTTTTRTTSTTTTTTVSRTTTTTTAATTTNICFGGSTFTDRLLSLDLTATLSWTRYRFDYVAPTSGIATISFILQNDPSYWYLDDVSITDTFGNQYIANGDFEFGNLLGWTYCNPNNAASSGSVSIDIPFTGSYSYKDGSVGFSDYLSQSFSVTANDNYKVEFWLMATSSHTSYALVVITV